MSRRLEVNKMGPRSSADNLVNSTFGLCSSVFAVAIWYHPPLISYILPFSSGRRQAIIWTNAGILLIGPLGTNFNEILIGIQTFSLKKMHLKMSSAKWGPFCLGLNVLKYELAQYPKRLHSQIILWVESGVFMSPLTHLHFDNSFHKMY